MSLPIIFFAVIALSVLIAVLARTGVKNSSMGEYLVGGRSFPPWLLYFLAVGEIYSIGTMIGLPSGIYSGGASYGIWFMGYILLAYPLGYFIAPLVWRAGVRYDAMTIPDVFGRHFERRSLEIVTGVTVLLAMVPWGQYQFIGMQVVLGALGLPITPLQSVILAAVIAFIYLVVSGVRSPAFVAILKDTLMLLAIVIAGVAAVWHAGGIAETFDPVHVPESMTTLTGSRLLFTITTIVFQSITFYLGFSAAFVFTSKSEGGIKASTVWMPLFMLMYPFLIVASFYGLQTHPDTKNPNTIFMDVTTELLPNWLVGVVAAGAGLSGILVLAVTALTIGGVVTRNLAPNVSPGIQRRVSNIVVAIFLTAAAALTLSGSTIMLKILALTYFLLGQLVPGWIALLFVKRVQPWAVAIGMAVRMACSLVFFYGEFELGGLNQGLVATLINLALVFGLSALKPARERTPMAQWRRPVGGREGAPVH